MREVTDAAKASSALEVLCHYCDNAESAGAEIRDISVRLVRSARPSMSVEVQAFVWRMALFAGQNDPGIRDACSGFLAIHRQDAWRWVAAEYPASDAEIRILASALRPDDMPRLVSILARDDTGRAGVLARRVEDEALIGYLRERAPEDYRLVPCGWFTQGGGDKADQLPSMATWLPSYYAARFPVTEGEWRDWDGSSRGRRQTSKGGGELPAAGVTWHQAVTFAGSRHRRLLTEAEWEKAARGPAGSLFPWGEEFLPGRANTLEAGLGGPTPVDAFAGIGDSGYGVSDMIGNVWEWTASRYAGYGSQIRGADHRRLDDTADRVLRGGAYDFDAAWCHNLNRYRCSPDRGWDTHGLRLGY